MKLKIAYILSDIDKSVSFEWIIENIDKERFELFFILLNSAPTHLENYLISNGIAVRRITQNGFRSWPSAIMDTYSLLRRIRPDAIHCHLIAANVVGLIAGRMAGVKKRIYTRHHSSLHHVTFKKGIFWDKLSNKLATHIIAISPVVKEILISWEKADSKKVVFIPHGFVINAFSDISQERIDNFKCRHKIGNGRVVVGVVSRFTKWKGVQFIIPAYKRLLNDFPESVLILLNAVGDYENEISDMLKSLPDETYRIIKFENDIAAAFKSMNIFVHVPIDEHSEAFGQVYVEALAAKTTSVFTLSGIAPDFVVNNYNAIVVPYKDADAIYDAIIKIITEVAVQQRLITNGLESIQKFKLDYMVQSLERLYAS